MIDPDRYVAALRFAAERHAGQHIPETELPYLVHVTSVAAEVIAALPHAPADLDRELAVECALLHDILEDTATTHTELAARFGPAVAAGVQALSKDPSLPKPDRMADSLRRIRTCPHAVWIVKLADRITNLSQPPRAWPPEKRRAYRDEARAIADALGAASPTLDARIRTRIDAYAAYL